MKNSPPQVTLLLVRRVASIGVVLFLGLADGCVGPNAGRVAAGAAVMSGIAATASGISRAQGGCYAACPTGTSCNRATGMCDELPCRGLCSPTERCEMTAVSWKCVPGREAAPTIEVGRKSREDPILDPAQTGREGSQDKRERPKSP